MNNNDPEAIPLQKVVSAQSTGARRPSQSLQQTYSFPPESKDEKLAHSQSHRFRRGLRKRGENAAPAKEPEEGALNSIGKIYNKIKNYSLVTRYLFYILPLGIAFAIPLVLGATVAPKAKIGGVRLVWFFTWIEIGKWSQRYPLDYSLTMPSMGELLGVKDRGALLAKGLPVRGRHRQLENPSLCFDDSRAGNTTLIYRLGSMLILDLYSSGDQQSRQRRRSAELAAGASTDPGCYSGLYHHILRGEVHHSSHQYQLPQQAIRRQDQREQTKRPTLDDAVREVQGDVPRILPGEC